MYSTCAQLLLLQDYVKEAFLPIYIVHYFMPGTILHFHRTVAGTSCKYISLYEKNVLQDIFVFAKSVFCTRD